MQVFHAAPHLEKVERVTGEFLRRRPRDKRAIIKRAPAQSPQSRGDRSARVLILHVQLDQRREAQPQSRGIRLGKSLPQNLIEQKPRLEIRPGSRVLNPAHALAQVQPLALLCGGPSSRCKRRRKLAVLLTYGSAWGSSPRSRNTAGAAGTEANSPASWRAGTRERGQATPVPF